MLSYGSHILVSYKRNGDTIIIKGLLSLYDLAFHKISLKDIASISYYFSSKDSIATMLAILYIF